MRNDANLANINAAMQAQEMENSMANANEAQNNANQGQSLSNMGFLLGGQGNVDIPTFSGQSAVGGVAIPDLQSLVSNQYGQQMGQYNNQQNRDTAQKNAINSAGGQLGSGVTSALNNSQGFNNLFGNNSNKNKYGVISGSVR
jgi:hypothetical protein